jgi:hypothetical protein
VQIGSTVKLVSAHITRYRSAEDSGLLLDHRQAHPRSRGRTGRLPVRPQRQPGLAPGPGPADSEHQRLAVGQVAVPFGACSEPSNVQAGGGACPFRFRCLGCGHFRTDPSYLPELRDYLDTLLRTRERVRAASHLEEWARTEAMPSEAEITRLRQLIRRAEADLDQLSDADRRQITQAIETVRATRRSVHLGMPAIRPDATGLPGQRPA